MQLLKNSFVGSNNIVLDYLPNEQPCKNLVTVAHVKLQLKPNANVDRIKDIPDMITAFRFPKLSATPPHIKLKIIKEMKKKHKNKADENQFRPPKSQ